MAYQFYQNKQRAESDCANNKPNDQRLPRHRVPPTALAVEPNVLTGSSAAFL